MGCLSGEWDETGFNGFMKEPDYNIRMMSIFSDFTVPEGHK